MFKCKMISEIPLSAALSAWNAGFQGYYADMRMDYRVYVGRMAREGIDPEHSVILLRGDAPAAFTLNAIRDIAGERRAWNGGTAVLPEYRGQGLGSRLMEENLALYAKAGVRTACLEAFVQNEKAIALYEKYGYRGAGSTLFYSLEKGLQSGSVPEGAARLELRETTAAAAAALPFYDYTAPWQALWPSLPDGRCLLAERDGSIIGYVQFRRQYSAAGELTGIQLYPGKLRDGVPDAREVTAQMLWTVFAHRAAEAGKPPGLRAVHISSGDLQVREWLEAAGFRLDSELLHMLRKTAE
ncbi:GNAT family N-acetyltransferase [Paenibacillus tengchongensis]|uniref:GNAT family N-acetyltransferase n=1 Tax=Paenibacillus tengchongensis TaxID=2608684 RepID=UPI00124EA5D3|nr:GNAT family N-acetyltransferase [Paenibacillus tengchongensis]